jgi:hypothetical protein
MAVVGMIGFNFPVTLASLAKINFHAGPSSFGLLTTSLAVGALIGALAGSMRRARPGPYVVLAAGVAFGICEFAVGFAPSFLTAALLLVPTGFFSIYLAQAANHRVQMGVASEYRGRVMSLYVLVFLGTTPIGASVAGWWGQRFGVPSSIWGAGLISLIAAVVALVWQLRTSGDRLRVRLSPRPAVFVVSAARSGDDSLDATTPVAAGPPNNMPEARLTLSTESHAERSPEWNAGRSPEVRSVFGAESELDDEQAGERAASVA